MSLCLPQGGLIPFSAAKKGVRSAGKTWLSRIYVFEKKVYSHTGYSFQQAAAEVGTCTPNDLYSSLSFSEWNWGIKRNIILILKKERKCVCIETGILMRLEGSKSRALKWKVGFVFGQILLVLNPFLTYQFYGGSGLWYVICSVM